ncbi:MAG: DUF5716 family protein [Lachnospiraceae bacterium]
MILQKKIPKDFYKLFRTQNMQYYMIFLVALYEENMKTYMSLGLTDVECRGIISDAMAHLTMEWAIEVDEDEEVVEGEDARFAAASPTGILKKLELWGWLKKDFDDKLNRYVYSFPEYSQLYVELFGHLQQEDDSKERESILAIYSALYTYSTDRDKNNDMLKNAMRTCRNLSQLLTNMQDGVRGYFEELAKQKDFIGIQEVLVDEINNSDSQKYAILTTTDSFYRYKEAIKELMNNILIENDIYKSKLVQEHLCYEEGTMQYIRTKQMLEISEDAGRLVYLLEREFDLMEQKYKKLIEQKSIFAKRALARIHYILQEGSNKEDYMMQWIHVLNQSDNPEEILEKTREKMYITSQYKFISDQSFSNRKAQVEAVFAPEAINKSVESEESVEAFVPKPLYSRRQLRSFKEKNTVDGKFVTSLETVQSMQDLEKLLFLWQEATENLNESKQVELGEEFTNEAGMAFTKLTIFD